MLGIYRDYIRGYIGIMEKKMETTGIIGIIQYIGIIGSILGLYWDNGEENGNYYIIVGSRGLNNYQYYGSIFLV